MHLRFSKELVGFADGLPLPLFYPRTHGYLHFTLIGLTPLGSIEMQRRHDIFRQPKLLSCVSSSQKCSQNLNKLPPSRFPNDHSIGAKARLGKGSGATRKNTVQAEELTSLNLHWSRIGSILPARR